MPPSKLELAVVDRDQANQEIKSLELRLQQRSTLPITHSECDILLGEAKQCKLDLSSAHKRILQTQPQDDEATVYENDYLTIISKLRIVQSELEQLRREFIAASSSSPDTSISQPHGATAKVKLPTIQIPPFSGRFEEWIPFKDIYEAGVHNSNIEDVCKLQYLKSFLRDEAYNLIKNITISNENYATAWKVLCDRYGNTRELVYSDIRKLFNIPCVKEGTAQKVQQLLDLTNECKSALEIHSEPTVDTMLVYMTVEKLDPETKKQWALSLTGNELPKYNDLCTFLEKHIRGLQAYNMPSKQVMHQHHDRRATHFSGTKPTQNLNKCIVKSCGQNHPLYKCSSFLSMSVKERNDMAKQCKLCFNCLRPSSPSHRTDTCNASKCRTCGRNHNTLLHYPRENTQQQQQSPQPIPGNTVASSSTQASYHIRNDEDGNSDILLSTAVALLEDSCGEKQKVRLILDNCSEAVLIREDCVKRLGLRRRYDRTMITGVGGVQAGFSKGKIENFILYSTMNDERIMIDTALILPRVTEDFPSRQCKQHYPHLSNITLSDPNFYMPGPIDILISAQYFHSILRSGKVQADMPNCPSAINTMFGWVLGGVVEVKKVHSVRVNTTRCNTDNILQKFWRVESMPGDDDGETARNCKTPLTLEERICEEHFSNNYSRDSEGRFCVKLPVKANITKLSNNREQAINRWKSVERRLEKNPQFAEEYVNFMQEYINLGHMHSVPRPEGSEKCYYLPHHFVVKPDSTTTKFRVVFDASAKTSSGLSLNDCLSVGATLQDDIFSLLSRFRMNTVAIKADIAKMFRQFSVHEDHKNLQRIVWRKSPNQPIQDYVLDTVTYGTACAPYLATRCLKELAVLNREKFPVASFKLENDVYVDDLVSGAESVKEAKQLISDLNTISESACLSFRKFSSNNEELLHSIPEDRRELSPSLSFDDDNNVKALGVKWNPSSDTFSFNKLELESGGQLTKRLVLSQLARVFDPLGFVSPVTINAKLFMQVLWKGDDVKVKTRKEKKEQIGLNWDEKLCDNLCKKWHEYIDQLKNIDKIELPRLARPIHSKIMESELHAFSDASEVAYGAVIYLRNKHADGTFSVFMLGSKSRVAPILQLSLPRLELCGAELATELLPKIKKSIKLECEDHYWTDSMIVLQWLASHPRRWQTFVANRVSKIQGLTQFSQWRHVKSQDNPADLVSRGITALELSQNSLWWQGPNWLSSNQFPESVKITDKTSQHMPEERKIVHCAVTITTPPIINKIIERFSALNTLIRSMAWIIRSLKNWKLRRSDLPMISGQLLVFELRNSLSVIVKNVQILLLSADYEQLSQYGKVKSSSKLSSLNPFLDENGVMRVGGRLQNSSLQFDERHPIIIPHNHHLTTLIIRSAHHFLKHGGNKLVLCHLRTKYWIVNAVNTIKFVLRKCVTCRRHKAQGMKQLMGSFPSSRVMPGRAFLHCGVDFAGPFQLKLMSGRGNRTYKAYFCIFICMATKAVHLEPVSQLSTSAFIATFRRFIARRGVPVSMESDCGTNFVGADKELVKLINSSDFNNSVTNELSPQLIEWKFIPPHAPHQGGIWEAGVKSVKYHLCRVVGLRTLTYEEFSTVLCQIEACLNSRPLCSMTTNPDDIDVLTPGHFLVGNALTTIPSPDYTTTPTNRLNRWEVIQQITQSFWKRWSNEYRSTLQQRWKWQNKTNNVKVNDLVLIHEDNVPPAKWKLGRIVETHEGPDNLIRAVTVKTQVGLFKRVINKLTPILSSDEQEIG